MNPAELTFGVVLVLVLLSLAGYVIWRQRKTLERTRKEELSADDRLYLQRQVKRRTLCSILMVVLAAMLIGWFFFEGQVRPGPAPAEPGLLDDARKEAVRLFAVYLIAFILVLLVVVLLAISDFLATARFGLRHQRQLEAERRAVLESETMRLRQQRNGHQ